MSCSQCGTELPSSATFCPRCGLSHQGTSGISSASAPPTTFSYLPAGVPPWPTSVPDTIPFVAVADPEALPLALPDKKTDRPRRLTRSLVLLVGLIVLVPLVGILYALSSYYINNQGNSPPTNVNIPQTLPTVPTNSTPAPTTNMPPLPTPTSFKDTSSKEANVSLQYPSDWQEEKPRLVQTSTYLGSVYPPQQDLGIQFTYLRFSAQDATNFNNPDQVNQAALASITQDTNFSNPQDVLPVNQQPTIAGVQWIEKDMTMTNRNGIKLHFTSLAVKRNTEYYQIFFFAPDVVYNEAMQKYFQPMLSSLKFLA